MINVYLLLDDDLSGDSDGEEDIAPLDAISEIRKKKRKDTFAKIIKGTLQGQDKSIPSDFKGNI